MAAGPDPPRTNGQLHGRSPKEPADSSRASDAAEQAHVSTLTRVKTTGSMTLQVANFAVNLARLLLEILRWH